MTINYDLVDMLNSIRLGSKVTLTTNLRAYRRLDGTLSYMVRDNTRSISCIRKLHEAFALRELLRAFPFDTEQQLLERYHEMIDKKNEGK